MPKVPMVGQVKENLNVPAPAQYDVGSAGVVNRAIAQAAGQVSDLGMSLLEKRKKAADNDYAFKTYVDDYQAIEDYSQQLKLEVGEDATGYAEKMNKFLEDRRTKNESMASSEDGLRLYREKSMSLFKGAEIEAQNFENTQKAKYYVKSFDENANKLASTFLKNPDYTRAKEIQQMLEIELEENSKTHFVDVAQREALKQRVRDSVAMSVYDGLDAQERHGEQMRLLKNTDEATDIFSGMDAEKRGALLRRSASAIDTQRRQGDAELRGRIADVMDAQMKGEEVDPSVFNSLINRIQVSGLRPDEKERFGDSLRVSSIVASEKKRLLTTPVSLWGNPEDVIPNRGDATNARVVNKAQAALAREMAQMRKEMLQDPATYALRSSPMLVEQSGSIQPGNAQDTQDFDSKLIARQQALGIGKTRILTVNQAQQVAQNFINQTPDEAARSALALKVAHGKYAPKVFAEIAKEGKLPADFMMISYVQSPQAATTIMDNLKRQPEINKAFKDKYKTDDATLLRKVSSKLDNFSSAIASQGTSAISLGNAMRSQVALEAKKRMVMGTDTSVNDAVDNAIDSVVKSNFIAVKSARSNFIMPRFDGNGRPLSEESVAAFVKAYSSREGFERLNVAVPKNVGERFSDQTVPTQMGWQKGDQSLTRAGAFMGGRMETGEGRFYKMLEREGYWVPSADNSELILSMKLDGKPIAVLDKDGNAIRRSFHDITFDQDDLTLSAATPFWKKLFKSNSASAGDKK